MARIDVDKHQEWKKVIDWACGCLRCKLEHSESNSVCPEWGNHHKDQCVVPLAMTADSMQVLDSMTEV